MNNTNEIKAMNETTTTTATEYTGTATYCPEDNKLRLYVGRVPRADYEALRSEGWTSTPKQDCDFVAHWTPSRESTALDYAGIIEDEDASPADRAADRAERFAGYRDKRSDEAHAHADRYEAGPRAHGFQSANRAEKSAARHDRIAGRAVNQWDKAEYWQRRTAGVISHALHLSGPDVRMGRIKELESDIRKSEKTRADYAAEFTLWQACAALTDSALQDKRALQLANVGGYSLDYAHPRPEQVKNSHILAKGSSLYTLLTMTQSGYGESITSAEACALWLGRHAAPSGEGPWLTHFRNRLAYENQMLEAQGGRAGVVEMIAGGFIQYSGRRMRSSVWVRIEKVNKSTASGRVTSVNVKASGDRWGNTSEGFHLAQIDVERLSPDCYRAPTADELAEFTATVKALKATVKAAKVPCPLVNPTDADAERLLILWNTRAEAAHLRRVGASSLKYYPFKPSEIKRITQAVYSDNSSGSNARAETKELHALGERDENTSETSKARALRMGPALCQIRTCGYDPLHIIILTDKPQKSLPSSVWVAHQVESVPSPAPIVAEVQNEFALV